MALPDAPGRAILPAMVVRSDITAIIPHFYEVREPNLAIIVDSLRSGSVAPGEIIIWHNERRPLTVAGALVVQSPRNIGAQARFLAALMARGRFLLFLDNDTAVRRYTLENLLHWARTLRGIVSLEGRIRPSPDAPYRAWPKLYGRALREPRPVDLSLGRGEMGDRRSVRRAILLFPFGPRGEMDDLWFSACCTAAGIPLRVVPCQRGASDLVDLPSHGVGLCRARDYFARRDATIREIAAVVNPACPVA